jgi:hypothetical protein
MDLSSVIIPKEDTPPFNHQMNADEEMWHSEIEEQIKRWRKHAGRMHEYHNDAGYSFKTKKVRYGLLPIIVPLIMSPLSIIISENEWSVYFNAVVMAIIGLFTGLVMFFGPGEKMQQHFSFSARYADIVTDIDAELVKYRQFRTSADVFTLKIKMMIDNLSFQEPVVPKSIITGKVELCAAFSAFCCCVSQKKERSSDTLVPPNEIVNTRMTHVVSSNRADPQTQSAK